MAEKKRPAKAKKEETTQTKTMARLRKEHPFETDSQIENRYGKRREHNGSDSVPSDGRGSNH